MKKNFDSNIFINFIPTNITQDDILKKFSQHGKILQHRVWQFEGSNFQKATILFSTVAEA